MVGTLKVDKIQRNNSDSDMMTLDGDGIKLNRPLVNDSGDTIINTDGSFSMSGSVLQIAAAQHVGTTSHISVTGNQAISQGTSPNMAVDITVKSQTSVNMVELWTSMSYGAANALIWNLLYNVDGGSWTTVTGSATYNSGSDTHTPNDAGPTDTGAAGNKLRGSQDHNPNYGWSYDGLGWGSRHLRFFHDHNQTAGSRIRYRVICYNNAASITNYILHANRMLLNWSVTEIGEI